jgi:hypothetical protein
MACLRVSEPERLRFNRAIISCWRMRCCSPSDMWLSTMARWLRSIARSMPEDNTGCGFSGCDFLLSGCMRGGQRISVHGRASPYRKEAVGPKEKPRRREADVTYKLVVSPPGRMQ